jgi:hypothetical protein
VAVEVLETPLAEAQAARLRRPAARAYQVFLDDLARRGCAALGYRVTGPDPLERLCVRHLGARTEWSSRSRARRGMDLAHQGPSLR